MKQRIFFAIALVLLTLIQASPIYDTIREVALAKPDLALILIVFIGFRASSLEGMVYGFAGGLLQDIVSVGPIGQNALVYLNIGFIVGFFKNKIYAHSVWAPIVLILCASVFKSLANFIISALFSDIGVSLVHLRNSIFIETAFNAILAPLFFPLYDKFFTALRTKTEHIDVK